MTIEQIKQKVDELDWAIDQVEQQRHQLTKDRQASYQAENNQKGLLLAKWLHQLRTPKVFVPNWCKGQLGSKLQDILTAKETDWNGLTLELNLYVLNAGIKVTQLDGGAVLAARVEELREISKKILPTHTHRQS